MATEKQTELSYYMDISSFVFSNLILQQLQGFTVQRT